jgi:hypothetical protein
MPTTAADFRHHDAFAASSLIERTRVYGLYAKSRQTRHPGRVWPDMAGLLARIGGPTRRSQSGRHGTARAPAARNRCVLRA